MLYVSSVHATNLLWHFSTTWKQSRMCPADRQASVALAVQHLFQLACLLEPCCSSLCNLYTEWLKFCCCLSAVPTYPGAMLLIAGLWKHSCTCLQRHAITNGRVQLLVSISKANDGWTLAAMTLAAEGHPDTHHTSICQI
jgi:hypothetical protein